jgi:hypothetical protein
VNEMQENSRPTSRAAINIEESKRLHPDVASSVFSGDANLEGGEAAGRGCLHVVGFGLLGPRRPPATGPYR